MGEISNTIIFIYGIFSFLFVAGGIGFSLREMRSNNFRTSDYFFLASALVGFLLANYLWFFQGGNIPGQEINAGIFVGIWVPSNLALGLYFRTISSK